MMGVSGKARLLSITSDNAISKAINRSQTKRILSARKRCFLVAIIKAAKKDCDNPMYKKANCMIIVLLLDFYFIW